MNGRGCGLAAGVVALSVAILFMITQLTFRAKSEQEGGRRMRRVYVALALYESDWGGAPASRLDQTASFVDPADLVSPEDPRSGAKGGEPLDPLLPELGKVSSRISITYLPHWILAKRAGDFSWKKERYNPRVGLLADPWQGGKFGRILRVNTDGSLFTLSRSESDVSPTFDDLFRRR